ncbi:MAG: hypothetical protein DCF32_08755 [Leptolyngbya sp.]|nr:MAG: hypothetical protein DCF32_08755 [Leptolyngbya sp.]
MIMAQGRDFALSPRSRAELDIFLKKPVLNPIDLQNGSGARVWQPLATAQMGFEVGQTGGDRVLDSPTLLRNRLFVGEGYVRM